MSAVLAYCLWPYERNWVDTMVRSIFIHVGCIITPTDVMSTGKSVPVSNFTTDNLRWLNNAQSAADSANFMANVKFPGIEEDLTASQTPWIYYGVCHAVNRSAFCTRLKWK